MNIATNSKPRALLLSAYDAVSHRHWRRGLVNNLTEYDWHSLVLSPRFFNWRIRGNSLTWSVKEAQTLERHYDLVVATSMTDLATLRGLVPSITMAPNLVYFHENQFAYPENEQGKQFVEAKMVTLYSALAADGIVFNSGYNRKTFIDGVSELLERMPDAVPDGVPAILQDKSEVLPVPLQDVLVDRHTKRQADTQTTMRILWNHRWEYDKAPERFFLALDKLAQTGTDFRLNVVGQQFRQWPAVFERYRKILTDRIDQWGMVDEQQYRQVLLDSDVVVSTALHDFQGLAVLEAVACGCIPLVPDRLAYPEFIEPGFRYASRLDHAEAEADDLAARLQQLAGLITQGKRPRHHDLSCLSWQQLLPGYRSVISEAKNRFDSRRAAN